MLPAAPVAVRHLEGLVHGFLVLRTLEGDTLADGDLIQVAHGDRVTSRLVFHFKDGSIHDDTAVFSQRRNFRLLSDHLVQKGPAFQHPIEVSLLKALSSITSGWFADTWISKGASPTLVRKSFVCAGLIISGVLFLISAGTSASTPSVVLLLGGTACFGLSSRKAPQSFRR